MYNYHIDLIWAIDKALLLFLVLLACRIILFSAVKEYSWKKYSRALLLRIKKDVYEAALSGERIVKSATSATPRLFLDVVTNRNRDIVFFNETEQKLFKDSFISPKRIAQLERISLKARNKWLRIEAILSLGYTQDLSALRILDKTILDKDEDVVYFSMIALSQIKTAQSAKILIEFLERNASAGFKIASILESFPPEITAKLSTLLKSESPLVRFWALKIISKFRPAEFIKDIENLTLDKQEEVRAAACECLGGIGERKAQDSLSKCLKDDSWLVRVNAIRALTRILGKDCLPEVMPLINDGSLSVIDAVKDCLVINIEAALPYIEKFLSGEDGVAKRVSVEALEASGYTVEILKGILSPDLSRKTSSFKLLEGMIKSGARFGLEPAINNFEEVSRKKLLEIVDAINSKFKENTGEKLQGGGNK